MTREIILDTETTGLEPSEGHRIIEIGAIEMINKVITGQKFHYYINPERNVPQESYRFHGIAGEFLKDKQKFGEIAVELLEFIKDSPIVAHNAPFDAKFLNRELALVNLPLFLSSQLIDTLVIARKKFPGMRVNLDALCQRFKVDNSARKFHGALLDAALLADVYIELLGGRQASFAIEKEDNVTDTNASTNNLTKQLTTKVVLPTKEELLEHKKFIANIPNPLWY